MESWWVLTGRHSALLGVTGRLPDEKGEIIALDPAADLSERLAAEDA